MGTDTQLRPVFGRDLPFLVVIDHAIVCHRAEIGKCRVVHDVVVQHQAELLAVFRDIGKTCFDCTRNSAHIDRFAMHEDFARDLVTPGFAEDAHHRFGPARTHQACDADHFAGMNVEIDIVQELPIAVLLVEDVPVLHLKQRLADLRLARRIAVFHVAADHALDDAIFADVLAVTVQGLDRTAIAQDGDLVGNLFDLVQLVRNDDRGHALPAKFHQQFQERVGIGLVERGGRLVEDEQPDLFGKRLGDFHELLLADADIRDPGRRRLLETDLR